VSFATITLCIASQRVFSVVCFGIIQSGLTQPGNFWIHRRVRVCVCTYVCNYVCMYVCMYVRVRACVCVR
jgi:hypothetical protein